jgi:hypothetical protein
MQESIAAWLDGPFFTFCFSTFFFAVYLSLGLSLWDKSKFPFKWRRVWAFLFLFLAWGAFCTQTLARIKIPH